MNTKHRFRIPNHRRLAVLGSLVLLVLLTSTVSPGVLTRITGNWLTGVQHLLYRVAGNSLTGALCVAGYAREAPSAIECEREDVKTERDAFREFAATLKTMTVPAQQQQSNNATAVRLVGASPGNDCLQTVRDCYRDTVMSVPDYEEQYEESLREHMAAELGEDLTSAVLGGDQLTDHLRRLLVSQAQAAAQQREAFLDTLDDEYDPVTNGHARLQKKTRLQGLKDRLAASDDPEAEELRTEIEELEDRIEELTEFKSGQAFHTQSGAEP